jgi:hypothetical protein
MALLISDILTLNKRKILGYSVGVIISIEHRLSLLVLNIDF